jgi:cytochrome c oxidase subunit II
MIEALSIFSRPEVWAALVTLVTMEIVLGIDNLIFISILSNKLPEHQRQKARRIGISLALIMRLALLTTIAWIVGLTAPVIDLGIQGAPGPHGQPTFETQLSWRDIILIAGGLFLVWKATKEIHHSVDPDPGPARFDTGRAQLGYAAAIGQILLLDLVFSVDSIITAVGMTPHIPIMVIAVIVAVTVMLVAATPLANFIHANPTVVMLALGFLLLLYALLRHKRGESRLNSNIFIILGGVVWPVVTLSALLVYAFSIGYEIETGKDGDALIVDVIGFQWWWEFRYIGEEPTDTMVTANELHIPVGRPVKLRLIAGDVIHTFWVPNLGGKRDLIPGRTNTLVLQADRPGVFRGQCNEFCGKQHALMAKYVIAQPEAEFQRWLDRQKQPAPEPTDAVLRRGREAFMAEGCGVCHQIRGTEARGRTGPDLTHFGARRTIAAGTLTNTHGNRQAWIVSAQHIKPENHMPDFPMDGPTLHALAEYLGSLE